MAAYPTFACGQSYGSTETIVDEIQVDRATNGGVRIRSFYTSTLKAFSVKHAMATPAEKAALDAFYATNRLISFDFLWKGDNTTYTCQFASPPVRQPVEGVYWEISCELVQVA